jgi:transcriptional regulator with XRE-family HTH domain
MKIVDLPLTVKELRESKGLSRRDVAVELDIADSTILRWEKGTREPHMSLGMVKRLLDLLDCDFDTLHDAFQETALMKYLLDTGREYYTERPLEWDSKEPDPTQEEMDTLRNSVPPIKIKDRLG